MSHNSKHLTRLITDGHIAISVEDGLFTVKFTSGNLFDRGTHKGVLETHLANHGERLTFMGDEVCLTLDREQAAAEMSRLAGLSPAAGKRTGTRTP